MSVSETTPLTDGTTSASSSIVDQMKDAWKKIATPENMEAARDRMRDLHRSATQGDFSLRFLALIAGVFLVTSSFFGILEMLLHLRPAAAVLEFYTFVMGCIMVLLESLGHIRRQQEGLSVSERLQLSTQISILDNTLQTIIQNARFLQFVWGRGAFYVFAGSLHFLQGSLGNFLVGGYVIFVGVMYMVVGRQTARKLTQLRKALAEHTLRAKFEQADKGGNGRLSIEELKHLTESLDMKLSHRECEAAFLCMDKRDAGYLTFEEFQNWWSDWGEGNETV